MNYLTKTFILLRFFYAEKEGKIITFWLKSRNTPTNKFATINYCTLKNFDKIIYKHS